MVEPDTHDGTASTTRRGALAAAASATGLGFVGSASASSTEVSLLLMGTEQYAENVEEYWGSYGDHMHWVADELQETYWSEVEDGDEYQLDVSVVTYDAFLVPESALGSSLIERIGDANDWIHERLSDDVSPEAIHVLDWTGSGKTLGLHSDAVYEDYTSEDDVSNTSIVRVDPEYEGYPNEESEEYFAPVDEVNTSAHEIFHQFGAEHRDASTMSGGYATVMHSPGADTDPGCFHYAEAERAAAVVSSCTVEAVRDDIPG